MQKPEFQPKSLSRVRIPPNSVGIYSKGGKCVNQIANVLDVIENTLFTYVNLRELHENVANQAKKLWRYKLTWYANANDVKSL